MPDIVPREVWCPTSGRTPAPIATPTPRLWLHHGATGTSDVDTACSYVRFHVKTRGWVDVGYSFLIADGQVLEGRGAGRAGAHTRGDNASSHGICMVGNYEDRLPADRDLDALTWLVRHGMDRGWWDGPITGGHRDAPGARTSCPGTALWRHIGSINLHVTATPEDPMADYGEELQQIVTNTRQTADDAQRQVRLSAALVEAEVAHIRAGLGLDPDPASDGIWSSRIATGSHTLEDVKERLTSLGRA